MKKTSILASMIMGIMITGVLTPAFADTATFGGSSGDRSAEVTFENMGSTLVVTLTNNSTEDVLVPVDVLTAVFWNITGNPTLTRVSGELNAGSVVHFGDNGSGIIGGEWAYVGDLMGAPGNATQGISSAGFDLFGPSDRFPGDDLDPPASVNGLNYGLLSDGDNQTTGNAPVTGGNPLIQNSAVFTLDGLPDTFSINDIFGVSFQYGTGLDDPNIPGDPEAPPDEDMDGVPGDEDCDDHDPNNFPGNEEICDGQDNDCDDLIDEGLMCEIVAGELLPTDSTSLFLAGLSQSMVWMIPTLAGIAGAGVIIRSKLHRD